MNNANAHDQRRNTIRTTYKLRVLAVPKSSLLQDLQKNAYQSQIMTVTVEKPAYIEKIKTMKQANQMISLCACSNFVNAFVLVVYF